MVAININFFIWLTAACVVYAAWQCLKQLQVWRIRRANADYLERKQTGDGASHSHIMKVNDRLNGKRMSAKQIKIANRRMRAANKHVKTA